nr:hypothetical protein [Tanacetum cinerariifolium]
MEEYIRLEEEKARKRRKVFNWEIAKYAIVYNDALTSKSDFSTEPTLCPQHIDEFDLKDETSLFECDEEEQNVLYFNDLFHFNVIYPDDLKSDKDNDDDKINIEHSSGDLSVKPLPDEQYTRNLLKKYEIFDSSSVKIPLVPPNNLGLDLAEKPVNETLYRGMIGSLMCLNATRPEFDLKGYSDSYYVGCNMDIKSTSGACQILRGKEFWCTSIAYDPNTPANDSEERPLKEFKINFSMMNGKKPLTLDFKTFTESTGLNYYDGTYVSHPSTKTCGLAAVAFTGLSGDTCFNKTKTWTDKNGCNYGIDLQGLFGYGDFSIVESHILDELVEDFSLILEYLDAQLGSLWQWRVHMTAMNFFQPSLNLHFNESFGFGDRDPISGKQSSTTLIKSDEGSMQQQLQELMDLCTRLLRQQTKMATKIAAQDLEISSLKARIKLLEDKDKGTQNCLEMMLKSRGGVWRHGRKQV